MKKVILNGIRKRAILYHTDGYNVNKRVVVMIPITDEQEKYIDKHESIELDGIIIREIYCYGNINVDNEDDANAIKNFDLINKGENDNYIYSNIDFEKGYALYDGPIPKMYPTSNIINWFKYNHLLIGKPDKILIYRCRLTDL